jgi:sulfopyruvate decarboxylase subunit beta
MERFDAVREVMDALEATRGSREPLLVVCNGMIGREVFSVRDRPRQFYMIGSMGLALSIGLGLALVRPERDVVVFDGDGNVLMGMGVLATAGALAPRNLWHVVFDNEAHGSTGDQKTVTDRVDLIAVAAACGYASAVRLAEPTLHALRAAACDLFAQPGPAALLVKVDKGNVAGIGRVTPSPQELSERFRTEALRGLPPEAS